MDARFKCYFVHATRAECTEAIGYLSMMNVRAGSVAVDSEAILNVFQSRCQLVAERYALNIGGAIVVKGYFPFYCFAFYYVWALRAVFFKSNVQHMQLDLVGLHSALASAQFKVKLGLVCHIKISFFHSARFLGWHYVVEICSESEYSTGRRIVRIKNAEAV